MEELIDSINEFTIAVESAEKLWQQYQEKTDKDFRTEDIETAFKAGVVATYSYFLKEKQGE